jgi:acetoin utilization deacetylase AcuC-like enzyme
MKVVWTNRHRGHDPRFFIVRGRLQRSAEQPERARVLLTAAGAAGLEPVEARRHPDDGILAVHRPDYVRFLQAASHEWRALAEAGEEVVANVHPQHADAYPPTYPRGIVGRAGWHMADTACPIGPHTYEAARAAADVALTATDLVLGGERAAYALCRPPGHHAYADMAGGFCFLNNAAIAAERLRARCGRTAVLDIDVHHGNGTQGIFWERGDVLTVSVHVDPSDYYPFFWGHAHERGQGVGRGANLNLPLPRGSADAAWLEAIDDALVTISAFAPAALVLALGLDPHEDDPLAGMRVTTAGFAQAGMRIAALGLPTVIVQEGGYLSPVLGAVLESFLVGWRGALI